VAENELMWREENIDADTTLSASAELRSVGVTANSLNSDLGSIAGATTPPPSQTGETDTGAESATPPA
jgi:hypothetical protein